MGRGEGTRETLRDNCSEPSSRGAGEERGWVSRSGPDHTPLLFQASDLNLVGYGGGEYIKSHWAGGGHQSRTSSRALAGGQVCVLCLPRWSSARCFGGSVRLLTPGHEATPVCKVGPMVSLEHPLPLCGRRAARTPPGSPQRAPRDGPRLRSPAFPGEGEACVSCAPRLRLAPSAEPPRQPSPATASADPRLE